MPQKPNRASVAKSAEMMSRTDTAEPSSASPSAGSCSPTVSVSPRYRVLGEHARGGIGRVMRAFDEDLERVVALKELQRHSRRAEARFVREAKITARLEHPAIVPIHDAGRWPDGSPYYAMKLVAGRSLRELLDERALFKDRMQLLPNVIAVAEALGYAHSRGVIHRDLKPSNIVVGDFGETMVIDWGLAKDLLADGGTDDVDIGPYRIRSDSDLTIAGSVIGTPAYMPPEQAAKLWGRPRMSTP
jgi:eukaryotic-like serine/threonine-protein kinase